MSVNQNEMPLTAECGFSSVKGIQGDRRCRIKTAYRYDEMYGVLFNRQKVVYGEEALVRSGSHCLMDIEDLVQYYPLFVHAVAKQFGINSAPILTIGLPYEYWMNETIKSNDGRENLIAVLVNRLQSFEVGGNEYTFPQVMVLPQGLGATKSFLAKNPEAEGDTLSIDLGFNTVIITLYSAMQRRIVYGETFYKRGVYEMTTSLLKPMIAKHIKDKTYTPAELNQIVENGNIQVGFKTISLEDEINRCAETYAIRILEQVMKNVRTNQGSINFKNIVFSGGGARLMKKLNLHRDDMNVCIADEPEMQNAIGFDIIAREALSQPKAA